MNDEQSVALEDLTLEALAGRIQTMRSCIALEKMLLAAAEAELSRRQEMTAARLLETAGKDNGSVTFTHDGMRFKGVAEKTVKWDSAKLQAVAATMPWDQVERLFKIEFSVPEANYKALLNPTLRDALTQARTTKIAPLKVVFVGRE
jgi:hypothetical protein